MRTRCPDRMRQAWKPARRMRDRLRVCKAGEVIVASPVTLENIMPRGRRTSGAGLVDRLKGPSIAKQRLRLILETMTGKLTVKEASKSLGIGVRRFHGMRTQFLQDSLEQLAPKPAGRPPRTRSTPDQQVNRLQAEVEDLRVRSAGGAGA